jgi:hypothetical protein
LLAVHSRIEALLGFEIEGERDEFRALAIKGIKNKRAIQYVRTKAEEGTRYLEPHMTPFPVSDKVTGPLIYVLGPPRKEELLLSMDPEGGEGYSQGFALDRGASAFFAAARQAAGGDPDELSEPFPPRHRIPAEEAFSGPHAAFFETMYGSDPKEHPEAWRRIDHDWLQAAEMLALRLNNEVNNTCLVLAIELPASKRVLLFPGDAQRGSWISWDDGDWITPAGEQVKAKELLGRVVFYKVGHHGSHNATLKGQWYSDHPNLNWMARDAYRPSFVAMIPANRPWAYEKADWRHPLPSIERALARKTRGRLFRTDRDHVPQSDEVTATEWAAFQAQTVETALYLEYTVLDEAG